MMIRLLILSLIFLPFAALAEVDEESAIAKYRAITSSQPQCKRAKRADEITVCANRDTDRYRVPFVGYNLGDPRAEGFWGEKERLQNKTTPCQDRGAFRTGCGSVGVTVAVGLDGTGLKWRKRAD